MPIAINNGVLMLSCDYFESKYPSNCVHYMISAQHVIQKLNHVSTDHVMICL